MQIKNYIKNEVGDIHYDLICNCGKEMGVQAKDDSQITDPRVIEYFRTHNSHLTCDCGRKYDYNTGRYMGRNNILIRLYDKLPYQIHNLVNTGWF